jgi:hypothetical protein
VSTQPLNPPLQFWVIGRPSFVKFIGPITLTHYLSPKGKA